VTNKNSKRKIKSADRTVDILEELYKNKKPRSLSELADATGLATSTVHTYLSTLKERGFVRQSGQRYQLGYSFIPIGECVKHRHKLYRAGRDVINELSEETKEDTHLVIEDQNQMLILYEAYGEKKTGLRNHEKKREEYLDHLHCTSSGKALLAFLPEKRVREIFEERGLPQSTSSTITDLEALLDELAEIREQGYAINDQEEIQGLRAVGAPIRDKNGDSVGAISVSGPAHRLSGDQLRDRLPEQVMSSANAIEIEYRSFE
jgi:DNA-binding IclR family transcriptional regulator